MPKKTAWNVSDNPARLWEQTAPDRVTCYLSPRNCTMKEGQKGFCGVRQNVNGKLVTLNYGRATHVTEESIETEATFHFAPGAPILSLGNIGCMMNCDYCQNWNTSQAKYVKADQVHVYTPQDVVQMAKSRNIPILSWTYNDPVVWHEFVLDTGRLAKENGLYNLYKSAFFISEKGAEELCEVVDIFSVSIKTMDEVLYRKISKGWLQPALDATKLVFDKGKHVEISMLMVTDANDTEKEARELARWVIDNMSDTVPVHFVRFHPDYKYTHVGRTPVDRLRKARLAAMDEGLKYVYLGNVYDEDGVNTFCNSCGEMVIERYGLNTWINGVDDNGFCKHCHASLHLKNVHVAKRSIQSAVDTPTNLNDMPQKSFNWYGDVKACHVELVNNTGQTQNAFQWRLGRGGERIGPIQRHVDPHSSYRFILSKSTLDETGVIIQAPGDVRIKVFEVLDRAHYPTVEIDEAAPSLKV